MQDTTREGPIMPLPRKDFDALEATDEYTTANSVSAKPLGHNRKTRRHPPQTHVKVVSHEVYLATKQRVEQARARRKAAKASRKQQRG